VFDTLSYNITLIIIIIIRRRRRRRRRRINYLWHFGPFPGHGLPLARALKQPCFYEVRISAPHPIPNQPEENLTQNLYSMGVPHHCSMQCIVPQRL
jgi:hypothetical protein